MGGVRAEGKAEFWFGEANGDELKQKTSPIPMHLAFRAGSTEAVDQFYQAAIEAGATDNGKPGMRKTYHPNYYGAFVIDPDGHNLEAVCHETNRNKGLQLIFKSVLEIFTPIDVRPVSWVGPSQALTACQSDTLYPYS